MVRLLAWSKPRTDTLCYAIRKRGSTHWETELKWSLFLWVAERNWSGEAWIQLTWHYKSGLLGYYCKKRWSRRVGKGAPSSESGMVWADRGPFSENHSWAVNPKSIAVCTVSLMSKLDRYSHRYQGRDVFIPMRVFFTNRRIKGGTAGFRKPVPGDGLFCLTIQGALDISIRGRLKR